MLEQQASNWIAADLPLSRTVRDRLVNCFNQFNGLLVQRSEDVKQATSDASDLITILVGLQLNNPAICKDTAKGCSALSKQADEPIFDLPASMISDVLNGLQVIDQIKSFGNVNQINAKMKKMILSQNTGRIEKLMKLQERSAEAEDGEQVMSVQTGDLSSADQCSSCSGCRNLESRLQSLESYVHEQVSELKMEIGECLLESGSNPLTDDLVTYSEVEDIVSHSVNELISFVEMDVAQLEKQMEEVERDHSIWDDFYELEDRLDNKIDEINIFRPKASYEHRYLNFNTFRLKTEFLGEFFYAQGIPFCMRLSIDRVAGKSGWFLGFWLDCMNSADPTWWSVRVNFKLKICDQNTRGCRKHLVQTFNGFDFSPSCLSIGKDDFISHNDLFESSNNFLKNGQVRFKVKLEAQKVVRRPRR